MLNCRDHLKEYVLYQQFSHVVSFIVFEDIDDLSIAKLLHNKHLALMFKGFNNLLNALTIGLNVLLNCECSKNRRLICFRGAYQHLINIICTVGVTVFSFHCYNFKCGVMVLNLSELLIAILRVFLFKLYILN